MAMNIVLLVLSADGAPNATADQAVGKIVPNQYQGCRNFMQAGIGFMENLVSIVVGRRWTRQNHTTCCPLTAAPSNVVLGKAVPGYVGETTFIVVQWDNRIADNANFMAGQPIGHGENIQFAVPIDVSGADWDEPEVKSPSNAMMSSNPSLLMSMIAKNTYLQSKPKAGRVAVPLVVQLCHVATHPTVGGQK